MLAQLVLYLLLAADGRGITVVPTGAPDEGCPSSRQITDALGARLPGTVAPPGPATGLGLLRLAVTPDPNGGLRVDVSDAAGASVLRRLLPPAPRTRPGDCAVLADTVALIVERYWREVGYDVPASQPPTPPPAPTATPPPPVVAPPPPPVVVVAAPSPPRPSGPVPARRPAVSSRVTAPPPPLAAWSFGAALAARTGGTADLDPTAQLAIATERSVGGQGLGLRLTGGVGTLTAATTPTGTATFRRFPFRIGGYLPITTPVGRFEPGIGAGLDLISLAVMSGTGSPPPPRAGALCSERLCASPGVDLALGWSLFLDQHLYLRAFARGGLTAPFAFVTNNNEAVWSTPRTYLEVALESGVWFP